MKPLFSVVFIKVNDRYSPISLSGIVFNLKEIYMKQLIARAALTASFSLGSLGIVGVASAAHSAPGTPGTPSCEGQTVAYLAQAGQDFDAPGLGNVSRFAGLSVKEVHAIVKDYCTL
jgi:hypothetical protein